MTYEKIIYPKNPVIKQYVHSFWILKSDSGTTPYLLPPDKCFNLILSYKSNTNVIKSNSRGISVSGSFIVGMRTSPVFLMPDGEVEYLGIEFYPYGLRTFLNFNCAGITDSFVEISIFHYELSEALKPVIHEFYPDEKRVEILEQRLLSFLYKVSLIPDKRIIRIFNIIEENKGTMPVNRICDSAGISERQLSREFERFTGVSPKFYSRIVRFNNFLKNIESIGNFDNLADLAYHCGYYDQAHMIHECAAFTGISPMELLK